MITVTLHANKSADLTYNSVTVQNEENYKIVEGENLATKVKIIYPAGYEQQAKYVTMKNVRGEFATVVLEGNGREYEIDIPGTMTYPGNIILLCVAGTANSSGTPKTVWLPVSLHVEATGVNCAKIARSSPDLILQCITVTTHFLEREAAWEAAESAREERTQECVTAAEEAAESATDAAAAALDAAEAAEDLVSTRFVPIDIEPGDASLGQKDYVSTCTWQQYQRIDADLPILLYVRTNGATIRRNVVPATRFNNFLIAAVNNASGGICLQKLRCVQGSNSEYLEMILESEIVLPDAITAAVNAAITAAIEGGY